MGTEIFTLTADSKATETPKFFTLVTETESGKEQRRSKWSTPLREWELTFKNRPTSEMQTLRDFFIARKGQYDSFYWLNPNEYQRTAYSVDSDYGSENTTVLPDFPIVTGAIVYDDGVALSASTDYSINTTTGTITWINKPAAHSVITATYQFYRVVRFMEDSLDIERVAFGVFNMKVSLKEVRA